MRLGFYAAFALSVLVPLAAYLALTAHYGFYTGTNYDAYQYTYALREGPELEREVFAQSSRVFVHALYYYVLRPGVILGLDAWAVFSYSSLVFLAVSAGTLYVMAARLGANPWAALTGSLLWSLSATNFYYANIPEVYPMWFFLLFLTVLAVWEERSYAAVGLYALAFITYVQSVLILPVFLWLGIKQGLKYGTGAFILGFAGLFIILETMGVPFWSHFAREKIYLDVASADTNWLRTNIVALRQSGVLIPLLLSVPLGLALPCKSLVFLGLGIALNLLFGLFWVKDQGAFLSPVAALTVVSFAVLATKIRGYRPLVALALALSVPMLQFAWKEAAYDRTLGRAQVEFCRAAMEHMVEDSYLVSTTLFPRWLYMYSLFSRSPSNLRYSPWAYVDSQREAMQAARAELFGRGSIIYADDTVHPKITEGLVREVVFTHRSILYNGYTVDHSLYRFTPRHTNGSFSTSSP